MTDRPNDLLLLAGKVICIFLQCAMVFGGVVLTLLVPVLMFYGDDIAAEFARDAQSAVGAFPMPALIGVFLIGIAILVAMFVFFDKLRQMIDTVGEGDPFQPANARRLEVMAWLMLGVQLLFIPAAALGQYLARFADEVENASMTVDGDLDPTGILLVVILFILARVFRHGAAMREDLEGTV